jgi:hypothetical protein
MGFCKKLTFVIGIDWQMEINEKIRIFLQSLDPKYKEATEASLAKIIEYPSF